MQSCVSVQMTKSRSLTANNRQRQYQARPPIERPSSLRALSPARKQLCQVFTLGSSLNFARKDKAKSVRVARAAAADDTISSSSPNLRSSPLQVTVLTRSANGLGCSMLRLLDQPCCLEALIKTMENFCHSIESMPHADIEPESCKSAENCCHTWQVERCPALCCRWECAPCLVSTPLRPNPFASV